MHLGLIIFTKRRAVLYVQLELDCFAINITWIATLAMAKCQTENFLFLTSVYIRVISKILRILNAWYLHGRRQLKEDTKDFIALIYSYVV